MSLGGRLHGVPVGRTDGEGGSKRPNRQEIIFFIDFVCLEDTLLPGKIENSLTASHG
jgi:hypothetical protein